MSGEITYRSGVSIKPIELFSQSKERLGNDYFLFVGICALGAVIAQALQIVLLGPMMCGMYLCFFAKFRGETVPFETLFKGFDFFKDSFIAVLIQTGVTLLLVLPLVFVMFLTIMAIPLAATDNAFSAFLIVAASVLIYGLMFIGIFGLQLMTMFCFHLIVDARVEAVQAIKLSYQGTKANLFPMVLYGLVVGISMLFAVALCVLPYFLLLPIILGANTLLYQHIFTVPVGDHQDHQPETATPPSEFSNGASTSEAQHPQPPVNEVPETNSQPEPRDSQFSAGDAYDTDQPT